MNPGSPAAARSAPGSILLTGEYMVTGEGGQGLAMAVGPRGHLRLQPDSGKSVEARWPGGGFTWTPAAGPADSLPAVMHGLFPGFPSGRLLIDTSDFFFPSGRKKGFGSSAAAAVLLAAASDGNEGAVPDRAVIAHRLFQGGRGSGYDVLASFHGRTGLFHGGEKPSWEPVSRPPGIEIALLPGRRPVKTAGAVEKFNQWEAANRLAAGKMRDENREIAAALRSCLAVPDEPDSTSFLAVLRQAAGLGIRLGESIGVPSVPVVGDDISGIIADTGGDIALKSLGAGNELILAAALRGNLPKVLHHHSILEDAGAEGLREELSA